MLTKTYLLNLYLFLLFILFFSGTGFSQNASYLDSLAGKFALQFQINENFSLSNFQGSVLSGKYHFSYRDAVRLGFSLDFGDSESETEINYIDTTSDAQSSEDFSKFGFTIKTQYIRYFSGTKDISFFGGIGPFVSLSKRNGKSIDTRYENDITTEFESSDFNIGLDLIAGVEWMFYTDMVLSSEYGLKFNYLSSNNEFNNESFKGESEKTEFNVTGNHINFGISVYF